MELLQAVWICVVIAIASASISTTITLTELFRPVRHLANDLGYMAGYLFQCFYCMSHWIIIFAIAIYQPILIKSPYFIIDLIISVFFTLTISTFINGLIFKVFSCKMKMKMIENEIAESYKG